MRYRCQYESSHPWLCETGAELRELLDDSPGIVATLIALLGTTIIVTFAIIMIMFAISLIGG